MGLEMISNQYSLIENPESTNKSTRDYISSINNFQQLMKQIFKERMPSFHSVIQQLANSVTINSPIRQFANSPIRQFVHFNTSEQA